MSSPGLDMIVCPCNQWSDFPQQCPIHSAPAPYWQNTQTWTSANWTPPQRLSDDDVDRIAAKVAEQLKKGYAEAFCEAVETARAMSGKPRARRKK